jgi:pyridoxal phosphate enzyme (YggS family)
MCEYSAAAQERGIPVVFGESYVQELKAKRNELDKSGLVGEFHLLGPLQSNKIRDAVRFADLIESVHSLKIIDGIAKEARAAGKRQSIFLQVNIGRDPQKSGFSKEQLSEACHAVGVYRDCLALRGLMTITPYYPVAEDVRADFRAFNEFRRKLLKSPDVKCFEGEEILLSMGMSSDFEIAIEEGADLVRVGTKLFGER